MYSLRENGFKDINVLKTYFEKDIHNFGKQLTDVRKKIALNLEEYASIPKDTEMGVSQEEEAELIMSGNLLAGLGIDLFNLQELGLEMTQVPLELWNKKSSKPVRRIADVQL